MKKLILLGSIVVCCLSVNAKKNDKGANSQSATSVSTRSFTVASVSGPTNVHGGEQHDYTLTDLPFGSTVTWDVLGDATIISASGNTVTLYFHTSPAGGGSNGVVTLKTTVSDGVNPPVTKVALKLFPTYCTLCP